MKYDEVHSPHVRRILELTDGMERDGSRYHVVKMLTIEDVDAMEEHNADWDGKIENFQTVMGSLMFPFLLLGGIFGFSMMASNKKSD